MTDPGGDRRAGGERGAATRPERGDAGVDLGEVGPAGRAPSREPIEQLPAEDVAGPAVGRGREMGEAGHRGM
jgi:hypothetical protein